MASRWCRFIFQLPAISGVRLVWAGTSVLQDRQAGQGLALEELQAGASPGGDVGEAALVYAERADRGSAVSAADDGQGVVEVGDRLGHPARASGVRRHLEHAHRAV